MTGFRNRLFTAGLWLLPLGTGVLSVAGFLAAARAGEPDVPLADAGAIQGAWECVATLKDGKQVEQYIGVRAVFRGDRLTWSFPQPRGPAKTAKAVFTLDPRQNPKHFDWHPEGKPQELHKRLYVLAGDTLLWSTNLGTEERPESFSAGRWMFVMKRIGRGGK